MKRLALLILSLLYLGTSIGAGINLHYCMGKLVDSSFFGLDAANCDKCGMDKGDRADNDCCKDEHKKVKVQDEHKLSNISLIEVPPVVPALFALISITRCFNYFLFFGFPCLQCTTPKQQQTRLHFELYLSYLIPAFCGAFLF